MKCVYGVGDLDCSDDCEIEIDPGTDGGLRVTIRPLASEDDDAEDVLPPTVLVVAASARSTGVGVLTTSQGTVYAEDAIRSGDDTEGWLPPCLVPQRFWSELRNGWSELHVARVGLLELERVDASSASAEACEVAVAADRPVLHARGDGVEVVVAEDPEWPWLLYLSQGDPFAMRWKSGELLRSGASLPPHGAPRAREAPTLERLLATLRASPYNEDVWERAQAKAVELFRAEGIAGATRAIEARRLAGIVPGTNRNSDEAVACIRLIRMLAAFGTPEAIRFLQTLVPPHAAEGCYKWAANSVIYRADRALLDDEWLRAIASREPTGDWRGEIRRARELLGLEPRASRRVTSRARAGTSFRGHGGVALQPSYRGGRGDGCRVAIRP